MKPKSTLRSFLLGCSSLLAISTLHAADGTWNGISGAWSDTTDPGGVWSGGIPADGADSTANFTGVNIAAAQTINLTDTGRTIGNITFTDATTSSHNLTISGANTLTLDRTDATKPTIDVTQSDRILTIGSVIDGADGLNKTGAGSLNLTAINTFTGDVVVDGGTFAVGANNAFGDITINGSKLNVNLTTSAGPGVLGAEGANVIFTGTSSFTPQRSIGGAFNKNVSISGTTTFNMSTQYYHQEFTGVLSGAGTIVKNDSNGILTFSNASNSFTGAIRLDAGTGGIVVKSLADSANPIEFNGHTGAFSLGSGTASSLVFDSRQIVLSHNNGGKISNNNADTSKTITINTDLGLTNTGTRTLTLAGSNTGANTFGGEIGDNGASAVSFSKDDAGKWILTGANTYTGNTSILNGTLEIRGAGQLGGGNYAGNITNTDSTPSPFTFDSSASQTLSGVISGTMEFIKDGAGTLSITGSAIQTGGTTVTEGTLSLGDGTNNANLYDVATLSVETGAVLDLNYAGSDTVLILNLGGGPDKAAGKWGRTGSIAALGADFESALITGDGLINNLAGNTTSIGAAFWDGGSVNIVGDGNATGTDADGTWDTTIENWDVGFTPHTAWPNTTAFKAYFNRTANAARTITLGSDITLGEIDLQGAVSTTQTLFFGNTTEDNTLNFGGASTITTKNHYVGFRCGISGAPTINYEARSGDNNSKLTLAPAGSLTMSLGAINMQKSTGTVNNCILELGGTSTGNSASSVTWSNVAQQLALNKVGAGTWTLSGGWDNTPMGDSQWKVQGGTLILNGNFNISHRIDVESGGTLKGNATLRVERTGAAEHVRVLDGGTLSPGTSIGTININDKATIAGKLKIEVNGASADLLAIAGDLDLSAATDIIEVVELGAGSLTDYLVVTYTGSLTGTFDTETLPPGYSVNYGTPNEIHLIGPGGGGSPYDTWAAGYSLQNPWLGVDPLLNGEAGANPDGDAFTNLKEFAFAFNPTVSDGGGTLTISGGAITQNGPPQIYVDPVTGQYFLRYTRRTDHVAAGLTYTAQFAADSLGAGSFEDVAGGSVVGTGTGAGGVAIEAVSIEFPDALPVSGKKARFGRVEVSLP